MVAFIFYNSAKASDEIDSVMEAVEGTELKYEGTRPRDAAKVYADLPPFIRRYVDYELDDDSVMHIVRKQNAFTFADNRA